MRLPPRHGHLETHRECATGTVLVIEYGKIEGTVGYYDPEEDGQGATRLVITSPPVESVNNRSSTVILGMTVGGGSAVNGQYFDRGSKYDYDGWASLGSPEFDGSDAKWDWENLYPSFQKVSCDITHADNRGCLFLCYPRPLFCRLPIHPYCHHPVLSILETNR